MESAPILTFDAPAGAAREHGGVGPVAAPRFAFLGICERAETVTEGNPIFWKWNLLGVSLSRAFYVFPASLRGMTIAAAIYQPKVGESFKLLFRGTGGQPTFDLMMQLASAVRSESQDSSQVHETTITEGVIEPGWVFVANQLSHDVIVFSPGVYHIFLTDENSEHFLGYLTAVHVPVAPYTPQEIVALRSDPLATKFVRMNLNCNFCHEGVKVYAGVERSPSLESQGFLWNLDIKEDEYVCPCGKTRVSLVPVRTGLHGFLRRNLSPQTQTNLSAIRLYEKTTLEQYCRELLSLIEGETREEKVQTFLEAHPIFFHFFLPKRIMVKPPILTNYFADFAVLNARDELLLIEIERPGLKMLKKDGGSTADLEHAFHQVRTWKQVVDDHRAAALDALDLNLSQVAKVRGVVIAGRKPADETRLRMLRALSQPDIELFTYDDLLNAATEMIKHIANV